MLCNFLDVKTVLAMYLASAPNTWWYAFLQHDYGICSYDLLAFKMDVPLF